MTWIQNLLFLLAAVGGAVVVFTRDPRSQTIVLSFYGILLSILFVTLQAPDVAFSEIVVGGAALPVMILVALVKTRGKPE